MNALIDQGTAGLGLELWKPDIFGGINSFEGSGTSEREGWIHHPFALLRLYKRKEAISLLEQAVWKHRMETDCRNQDDLQGCYSNSGTVIQNVLPSLGSIDRKLTVLVCRSTERSLYSYFHTYR